jgi:2-polyprenyl-3-methyl-5-hydroxy-6-metoxy-1,4-benzoquinol methylase
MPPDVLDFSRRAELTELMDEPCSREEMRNCLRDVARLNRWFLGYRPTLRWLETSLYAQASHPVHIVDIGCGYGDLLRRVERWAAQSRIPVALTGCDLNPDTVAIAAQASPKTSRITWVAADVFDFQTDKPIDIVVSSLFTHHLAEEQILRFLIWMETNARIGWFINDLSRASIPYQLLKAFSKVVSLHPFVQHDGPVSIARSFVADDWRRMCTAAGLNEQQISIESFCPARLCVGRQKQRSK